jgi:acyl-CoA thioesterase-2
LKPLRELLRVEPAGEDRFRAQLIGFGGVTLGCATLAAARTCPERALHSLHMSFLRPVPPGSAVDLVVERLRDGRRFAHRRVQIRSEDRLLCELIASFASDGAGVQYQDANFDPATPRPDDLPSEEELARAEGVSMETGGPFGGPLEWRWIGTPWQSGAKSVPSLYRGWVRPRTAMPNERAFNAALLAYSSDYHSHLPVARRIGGPFEPYGYTSLDQIVWAHREEYWDDWRLLTAESDVAHGGRAFTRRTLHARDGRLIASMAQEMLLPDKPGSM